MVGILALVHLFAPFHESTERPQSKEDIIDKFCEEMQYCRFGCGGGVWKDYNGYHCGSDHK
jgi:hypothetical protein